MKKPLDLQEHFRRTYFWLRTTLAGLALAFPFLLAIIGIGLYQIPLQGSLSAYYFAFEPPTSELREFPMRGVFVGVLCVLGCFLILYRGFSTTENVLLTFAGACALVVAFFPMDAPEYCKNCGGTISSVTHGFAAVLLFISITWVAVFCSEVSLGLLKGKEVEETKKRYRGIYYILGFLMLVFPVGAYFLAPLVGLGKYRIISAEAFGIWFFGLYWLVKTFELRLDNGNVERKAIKGEVAVASVDGPKSRMRAATFLD